MKVAYKNTLLMAAIALNAAIAPVAAAATLDHAEETHLVFMREEEKLARDVYLTFAQIYPNQPVFQTIATSSEQTHTDTMRDKLAQYNITDPNPDTNNLPSSIGIFTGAVYGPYFTEKFSTLTSLGMQSELHALYVGALIEELDMHDIVACPKAIVETDPAIEEGGCGLDYTDEKPLKNAYSSLIDGSESHLRSYVGQIEAVIGVGNYEAQYLTQEQVDAILGR
ncbi:MAG TPA: DUF2202 domain-containing protein [Gammaproteobacteria bacterium]